MREVPVVERIHIIVNPAGGNDPMTTRATRSASPEARELERKKAELASLEARVAERELDLATFRAELLRAHYHLAVALEMKGDHLAALDEIEIAREQSPNDTSIAEAYERIRGKTGRHG